MKQKDDLFMLIKSMDKNEKGYFHKFSGIHGNKRQGNYLKLFDCIAAMETYDEAKIHAAFKGEKFLTQLAVTKIYLRNLIIKALRNYANDSDPDIQMLNAITEVSLLSKRKMYESALKLLNKLKKTIDQREAFVNGLHVMDLEYTLLLQKGMHRNIVDNAEINIDYENKYLMQYRNLQDYKNLQIYIGHALQLEGMGAGGSTEKIRKYLDHPLLKDEKLALSFRARCFRFELLSKCYLKVGDKEKALKAARQFVNLFDDNPHQIKLLLNTYMTALNRLITRCTINHKYDEALKYIGILEALLEDPSVQFSESDRHDNLLGITLEKLVVYAKSGEFEKGVATETTFASFEKEHALTDQDLATANYFLAWCKLALGQPENALKKINRLINNEFPDGRKDVILCAYGMNILIHFELGNYTLIKRLLKMLHNYAVANKFPTGGWVEFVKRINELVEAKEGGNAKRLKEKLSNLLYTAGNYDFIEIALFTWWLNDKLHRKPV